MRQLHVVAVSEDGRHVVLAGKAGATRGGFRVALDERLAAAVRGDLPRPGDPEGPELTPKEIQSRLRAGETAESIALSAGVPVTRVERFSGPVQGEMARMIDAARSAHLVRGRLGRSDLPLGRAVDAALEVAPSLRPDSVEWSTFRDGDGQWVVTVTWFARARTRSASWWYDPATKVVTATDAHAAALAHHDGAAVPRARRTTAEPAAERAPRTAPSAAKKKPGKKASAKKAPAKKAPATKASAKKAAAKKATPSKALVKKATPKKAPAKRAPAKRAPAKRAPAKQALAKKAPAKKAPAKRASAKQAPARRTAAAKTVVRAAAPRRALRVVPDPPVRSRRAQQEAGDGVKTRASVPGWADVLLGTSPGGER